MLKKTYIAHGNAQLESPRHQVTPCLQKIKTLAEWHLDFECVWEALGQQAPRYQGLKTYEV